MRGMTNRAAENLALLDAETERLLATCAGLTDADRPSLCEGWSVAHVLTHVARNADADVLVAQNIAFGLESLPSNRRPAHDKGVALPN